MSSSNQIRSAFVMNMVIIFIVIILIFFSLQSAEKWGKRDLRQKHSIAPSLWSAEELFSLANRLENTGLIEDAIPYYEHYFLLKTPEDNAMAEIYLRCAKILMQKQKLDTALHYLYKADLKNKSTQLNDHIDQYIEQIQQQHL